MKPDLRIDTSQLEWIHFDGGPEFDYPIDYDLAVLGAQPEIGRIDLVVRWAPNAYCHFHRHNAATTTLVIEGEQHVYETALDGSPIHKVRQAGTYARSPGGDVHMERGGAEGALVFFAMHSPTGQVFDLLDADRNVLLATTVEEMAKGVTPL